ncbi:D-amino acid aminotransferase [Bacillus marinisedimentorum]|uniref:D-amino acid aminotransferase n=1 Tax=Bacillus marinisedimentorum TaxID=1821260 RepID=UPI000871D543|nr:D-amino acid aminotransferase [Bacillus marinisedimentorum]
MEIGFYNGEFIPINKRVVPIQERGHQFGDGVYEVIRVYNGVPFLMEEHLDRLEKSASAIQLELPYRRSRIEDIILDGLKKSQLKEAEIYLQITRGIAPRSHPFPDVKAVMAMTVRKVRTIDQELYNSGASVLLHEDERWKNCYIKSLNLLPNIMAKQAAMREGYDEAVFIKGGFITEGSSTNVFIVSGGMVLTTPATHRILHGITREMVLDICHDLDIPVKETDFTPEEMMNADEVFLTSTTLEVMPVSRIGDLPLQHPEEYGITQKIHRAYKDLYQSE